MEIKMIFRVFIILVQCLYFGATATIGYVPCGYQRCDRSKQTCRGNPDDYNSLRCYACSDFIGTVQKDCAGTLGQECSEYCIVSINVNGTRINDTFPCDSAVNYYTTSHVTYMENQATLQRILTGEKLAYKEKVESLQLSNRKLSSLIETLKKKKKNYIVKDTTNNILYFQIGTWFGGLFFVLFVVMLVLYCCICRERRKSRQSYKDKQMKSSSRTSSLDSGNGSISEVLPMAAGEQDRLRQVIPNQTDGTDKVLPTGGKSVQNLHQDTHDLDEHQSFLKKT